MGRAVAIGAAFAGGGAAGALLGVPSVSNALSSDVSPDDDEAGAARGWPGRGRVGARLEAAAEALGMTEDELRDALAVEGTSIADVATEAGVEVQAVIDALVADATDGIDQAVTDGEITEERTTELKADLTERITALVNDDEWCGPGGRGRGGRR